ncbi:MAG: response regulator [Gammaproteobacteria bacterium]|nr:response regulator [Gammaproteobacteria bacterium]
MTREQTPRVLVVDDEPQIRSAIGEILTDEGYNVALAAGAAEARHEYAQARPDLILLDVWMEGEDGISLLKAWSKSMASLPPVLMMSGHGTVDTAIEATRLGALDFVEKPLSLAKLLHTVEQALKTAPRQREPLGAAPLLDLIAAHPEIARLKREMAAVLGHAEPILFIGESGSGRETLARRLAREGNRAFLRLPLAGAAPMDIRTRIEDLDKPTLVFLGGVDDAEVDVQEALIRMISRESGRLARFIASARPAAGNSNIPAGLQRDLYDRVAVFRIEVPSLREYRDYLPEIIRYYVDELADLRGYAFRRFDAAALNRLRRHDWPGNLRELINVLKRLLAGGSTDTVSLHEADGALMTSASSAPRVGEDMLSLPFREARDRFERAYLEAQLDLVDGKVAALAERVGLERTHLYRKLKALGIDLSDDRIARES